MRETTKPYAFDERTYLFAKDIRNFVSSIPKKFIHTDYLRQLLRSSSSVGANYIEANESLSKKDFQMRIKIAKKEARETIYWLRLLTIDDSHLEDIRQSLIDEATQLMKILGGMLSNSMNKK